MTDPETVGLVCKRFPAWREVIETLYRIDPNFREMCFDYQETVRALAHWTALLGDESAADQTVPGAQTTRSQAKRIVADYWQILQALEEEIGQYLCRPHRPLRSPAAENEDEAA